MAKKQKAQIVNDLRTDTYDTSRFTQKTVGQNGENIKMTLLLLLVNLLHLYTVCVFLYTCTQFF